MYNIYVYGNCRKIKQVDERIVADIIQYIRYIQSVQDVPISYILVVILMTVGTKSCLLIYLLCMHVCACTRF